MAVIPTTAATPLGVVPTFTAATAGPDVVEVGNTLTLVIRNASGVSTTITVQTPLQVSGADVAEVALVVTAGNTGFIALDPTMFKRPSAPDAGSAYVTASPTTSVTFAVIQR